VVVGGGGGKRAHSASSREAAGGTQLLPDSRRHPALFTIPPRLRDPPPRPIPCAQRRTV